MAEVVVVGDKARQHVREALKKYDEIKKDIMFLGKALNNPYRKSFEVARHGRTIRAFTFEQISFKVSFMNAVDSILEECNDQQKMIITLRYSEKNQYSWIAVSLHPEIFYSVENCRKIEKKIVDDIARKLGW